MGMTDWITAVEESLTKSTTLLISFVPKVFGALLLLLAGFLIGRVVSAGLTRVLQLVGIDRLLSKTAMQTVLERAGTQKTVSEILGVVGFWIVFLLFLISATETLGLAIVSQALTGLAYFLPKVGLALIILVIGLFAANFLKEVISLACTSAGISQGPVVAQTFYVGMALLVVVTTINELGIDTSLLNNTIVLLVAGIIAGSSLSFGLGAKNAIGNLIAAHYLQPVLKVGQKVKVGAISGEVVSLTPVAVVIQTKEGRAIIPASQFSESTTIIQPTE
jgi:hypothetical protein